MLAFNGAAAFKALRLVGAQAKWIPETRWRLDADSLRGLIDGDGEGTDAECRSLIDSAPL
jgi:hypothetical protein